MVFEIEGNIVKSVKIVRGCPGNTIGIAKLIEGLTIDEIIKKLREYSVAIKEHHARTNLQLH